MKSKSVLIIGAPGVGKTWLMNQLIDYFGIDRRTCGYKTGLYQYLMKDGIVILGRYVGAIFDGSDKLSMAIMKDNEKVQPIFRNAKLVIGEGDRFTNNTFIQAFKPQILKIKGDGEAGRLKRGTKQTERQIKSITTRVNNINAHFEFENSSECFNYIKSLDYASN